MCNKKKVVKEITENLILLNQISDQLLTRMEAIFVEPPDRTKIQKSRLKPPSNRWKVGI